MALAHGLGKMQNFSTIAEKFPDPFGIGSTASLALAVFAELFCGLLLAVGAGTRLAASQLMVTMGVAMYCHMKLWGDPLFASGGKSAELAFVYLIGFTVLLFTGPGRFSIDHLIVKKWGK
jgi:putative oxidoreductase